MIKVVYPGTFDPITRGHEDVVRRAAGLFDEVVVAVAASRTKTLFSLEDRVAMAREVFASFTNVHVEGFDDLLMNYVRAQEARVVLRGLRAVSDFEYELMMVGMNSRLDPEVETVFLMASDNHSFIASRLVKEVAGLGGDVSSLVAAVVHQRLIEKLRAHRA